MGAPVTTSGTDLRDFVRHIDAFASGRAVQKAVGAAARELNAIHAEAFDGQRSPEGTAWLPLKRPRVGGRILDKSSRLRRAATHGQLSGLSVTFGLPVYGPVHQRGSKRVPARPFLTEFPFGVEVSGRIERAIVEVLDGAR